MKVLKTYEAFIGKDENPDFNPEFPKKKLLKPSLLLVL